ncbi:MAG: pilus assembly protein [Phycisphaerae bacterium]|nr:pilus assembly protein [Phycisphaerae bacterium]
MSWKHKTRHNRKGTALIEFVVCIPLLALIIAATFFFGMLMRNQQRLRVADRYVAWRNLHNRDASADATSQAYVLYGEPDEGEQRDEYSREYLEANSVTVTTELLSQMFFQGRADEDSITITTGSGPAKTLNQLIDEAKQRHTDTGDLAKRSIDDWPHGQAAYVNANFPNEVAALERIEAAIHSRHGGQGSGSTPSGYRYHVRDGVQWRRWQSSYLEPIREVFLFELDDVVESIQNTQLQENLQNLYLQVW